MQIFKVKSGLSQVAFVTLAMHMSALWADTHATKQVADNASLAKQDLQIIKQRVHDFLITQTMGYPGKVSIAPGNIDPNLKLASCADVNVFIANGSRAWGKTQVGVRCNAPSPWTIYMQASVNVEGQYLAAAAPLAQGQTVTSDDLLIMHGDLTQFPAGVFTEASQAIGRTVHLSMAAGAVLRQDMLKQSPVVQPGQTVTLQTKGNGFLITAEGQAMAKATDGQVVQVKLTNGQTVSGIARQGAKVEVTY